MRFIEVSNVGIKHIVLYLVVRTERLQYRLFFELGQSIV